jgi:ABC-2 type transport system ATP-binding protein
MPHTVEVEHLAKSFGSAQTVTDVSFAVAPGEIFGLLGPNGAGKTTSIRIMLDVFKPDRGTVSILGGPMSEQKKGQVGYMPEERGLYQDISLERCLIYLATLKGLPQAEARQRVSSRLKQFDLAQHRTKKVKELSKGMQQKAQIISTVLHDPALIIMDEPFAALDPVNVQVIKDLLQDMRRRGATIILSTHQMHHAEELCDRLVLINKGTVVLDGTLDNVRRQFAGHAVNLRSAGSLPAVPGVTAVKEHNHALQWTLAPGTTPQDVLKALVAADVQLEQFEIALPSLEEVFIRAVGGAQ